jgi:mannosyl-oligosaccharide glucosidase
MLLLTIASVLAILSPGCLSNEDLALRWGTYHSGLYYGIRSRTFPRHVSAGLLWSSSNEDVGHLRHQCSQDDRLEKYGWQQHNGRNFGLQNIYDQHNRMSIETVFLKTPEQQNKFATHSWASRITARSLHASHNHEFPDTTSIFFYIDLGCEDDRLEHLCRKDIMSNVGWSVQQPQSCAHPPADGMTCLEMKIVSDHIEPIWSFHANVQVHFRGPSESIDLRYWGETDINIINVKDKLIEWGRQHAEPGQVPDITLVNGISDGSSIVVIQVQYAPKKVTEVALHLFYEEGPEQAVTPVVVFSDIILGLSRKFDRQFQSAFRWSDAHLHEAPLPLAHLETAQAAFSSLLGGIAYSYGGYVRRNDIVLAFTRYMFVAYSRSSMVKSAKPHRKRCIQRCHLGRVSLVVFCGMRAFISWESWHLILPSQRKFWIIGLI